MVIVEPNPLGRYQDFNFIDLSINLKNYYWTNTVKKVYIIILIALFGCKQKPVKLNQYSISIDRESLNITGSALERDEKIDTLMAVNDTIAYQKGLFAYYANLMTDKRLNSKMGNTYGFRLTDTTGNDISIKLGIIVTDSIKREVENLPSIKNFLNK